MKTIITYESEPYTLSYWEGEFPFLLHRGMILSMPQRSATRVTDVRLVILENGEFHQTVTTGLVNIHDR